MPQVPVKQGRGHPRVYSDRLFLKALVIMIVRHLHTVHELLTVLEQPTAEMAALRQPVKRTGTLSQSSHLGAAFECPSSKLTCSNWLFGSLSGQPHPALARF